VAPAGKVDGVRAVLKVGMPHREARTEAAGLRFFAGQGAVRLLRADEEVFALVEERCEPGNELWDLPVDEGNQVATELLRRLWRRADGTGPIERLSDLAKEWGAGIPGWAATTHRTWRNSVLTSLTSSGAHSLTW
jgi:streptomycin 6-kinase